MPPLQPQRSPLELGRREFLRGSAAVAATTATISLTGCATAGGGDDTDGGAEGAKSKTNPLGVDPAAALEVVIFKGGSGDAYAKYDEKLYHKRYPKAKVTHVGIQKINSELRPRFVAGNPPDVVQSSGADMLNLGALVNQDQLTDLKELLAAPAIGIQDKTVRQSLVPGALDPGTFDGTVRTIPYILTAWGLWYDASTFDKHGLEYPKTWSGLLDLCAEIKKSGAMAPFIYQGQYPSYLRIPMHGMAFKISGRDVYKAIDNLEPKAWLQDEIVETLNAWYQLAARGYVYPGTAALTHTQSQARWLQGKAALIPCGSWLENEMKGQIPGEFAMTEMATPSVTDHDKVPFGAIQYFSHADFIVPTKASNANGGLEFLRILCGKKAVQKFAELTHQTTIVAGVHDKQELGPAFQSVNEAVKRSKSLPRVPVPRYDTWYKPLSDEVENALGAMMTKKVSPEQTAKRIQRKADEVKDDDSIEKHHR